MGELSKDELIRYRRQTMIRGWGAEGQRKIKAAKVAVVGVGGLGCPASLYLAAAGVGSLRIIDCDSVELSNLNRQILHWTSDVDRAKVESAAVKLPQINPGVSVEPVRGSVTAYTVGEMLRGVDLVVDGLDNLETRMVVNSECVRRGIPFIYSAVYGMEGFLTTILPGSSPCLKCIYPGELAKSEDFPVLGTTPGVMGCLQATEALKLITGIGECAVGRMVIYDGGDMTFRTVEIRKSEDCPVCGHMPENKDKTRERQK